MDPNERQVDANEAAAINRALRELNHPWNIVVTAYNVEDLRLYVAEHSPLSIRHFAVLTDEVKLRAVKSDAMAIECFDEQTEEICLAAMKKSMFVVNEIRLMTPKILAAQTIIGVKMLFIQALAVLVYVLVVVGGFLAVVIGIPYIIWDIGTEIYLNQ